MSDAPVPPGFRSVPPFVGDTTMGWIATILMGTVAIAFLIPCLIKWRSERTPFLPWLLVACLVPPFLAEPILFVISGIYVPKELPLRMFTVLGRPVPFLDMLMYVWAVAFVYLMYDMLIRGWPKRYIWYLGGAFAVVELLATDLLLVAGKALFYYDNPFTFFGQPFYVPIQYASMAIGAAVVMVLVVPHMKGVRWAWLTLIIPMYVVAQVMVTGVPAYIAIHSDYPGVVNWGLAGLTTLLCWAWAWAGLNLEQVKQLSDPPAESLNFWTWLTTSDDTLNRVAGSALTAQHRVGAPR